jgi:uncharacterized protein (DUF1697 family)
MSSDLPAEVHVAFFRALNQGHPRSPTRPQLEDAFRDAGADPVRCVQGNGTVVFSGADPAGILRHVGVVLRREADYDHPAMVRTARRLKEVLVAVPWTSPREDLVILTTARDHTVSVIRTRRKSVGDPNGHLERLLGLAATTRATGTCERVLKVVGQLTSR